MYKYKDDGYSITVDLPKTKYSVECKYQYDKNEDKYLVSMWLKHNDTDDRFKLLKPEAQEIDTQYVSGDRLTIRSNLCRIVEYAHTTGYFKKYIERIEFTYKCCEVGFDALENQHCEG